MKNDDKTPIPLTVSHSEAALPQFGGPMASGADTARPMSLIEALYRSEATRLRRYLARHARSDADAQDLVQDAFLRLGTARLAMLADPKAYLQRIARNLVIDRSRRSAQARRLMVDMPTQERDALPAPPTQSLEIEAADVKTQYEKAISQLPARTREIYLMHRLDGMTYGQIAEHMGVSIKAIEYHISAALKLLFRALDQA